LILVDTCVLLDVVTTGSPWSGWSAAQLGEWGLRGPLLVNAIVYAELCAAYDRVEQVDAAVDFLDLDMRELPRPALFLGSQAHKAYRRRGGARSMVLPDFLIGAHAAVERWPVLTRDRRRFATYFPTLEIVSPD